MCYLSFRENNLSTKNLLPYFLVVSTSGLPYWVPRYGSAAIET